jgi:hypothetical protein
VHPDRFNEARKPLIQNLQIPPLDDAGYGIREALWSGFSPNHAATIALLDRIAPEDRRKLAMTRAGSPAFVNKTKSQNHLASDFANFLRSLATKFRSIRFRRSLGDHSAITNASLSPCLKTLISNITGSGQELCLAN